MVLLLGLTVGAAGGLLFLKMKVPAGAMIGSVVFVAAFNIAFGFLVFPIQLKVLSQICAGAFIGQNIRKDVLILLRSLIRPALLLGVTMQLMGLAVGFTLYAVSGLDLVTCLLAGAPGGMMDMTLISMDMGADVPKVTVLHLIRLVSVIVICPVLNKALLRWTGRLKPEAAKEKIQQKEDAPKGEEKQGLGAKSLLRLNGTTLLVAGAFGMVGYFLGLPAGVLLFSMAGTALFATLTGRAYLSKPTRKGAQIVAGSVVGQSFTMQQVLDLREILLPAVIMVTVFLLCNILVALLLWRVGKLDITTALFSSTPAGASDMALIASDIGADGPQVALLHVARLVCVIAIFPQIVSLFAT